MIEFLLSACLLLLLLIAGGVYATHERIRKKLREFELRFINADLQMQWRHTSSLTALYRILDGKDWLPDIRGTELPPDLLLHIAIHIQRHSPRKIIECGCGTSTVIMAYALEKSGNTGHIHSIEEHPRIAAETRQELKRRGLDRLATIIDVPLTERRYLEQAESFHWYDLSNTPLPPDADLLLIAGPRSHICVRAYFPAGVELLPKLSRRAHIFVANADPDLKVRWRALYPNLGVLELAPELAALEMYFLDHKIREFMPGIRESQPRFE